MVDQHSDCHILQSHARDESRAGSDDGLPFLQPCRSNFGTKQNLGTTLAQLFPATTIAGFLEVIKKSN